METTLYWVEKINDKVNAVVWGPVMLAFLLLVGVYYTIRLKGFQISRLPLWFRHTMGSFFRKNNKQEKEKGSITAFQAMTTALAGAIGTGNIVGVATAITLGGAGAVFWMWVAALFGMMTVFAENILGVKFRKKNTNGQYVGGPMYYIEQGLHQKWLSACFCIFCIFASFGMGNMTQANSVAGALQESIGVPPKITGIALAVLCGLIIFGGIGRIAKVTEKVVPFMAIFFLAGGIAVIAAHASALPEVFRNIIEEAFNLKAAAGGAGGCVMASALKYGVARGVFSNEAGLGSTPIVYAAADRANPVEQGMWGIFQVFLDTIVMCTVTALCILCSGALESGKDGVALSTEAFSSVFGNGGEYFVAFSTVLFAFATLVSWSYYGERAVEYLGGGKAVALYKAFYLLAAAFGSVMDLRLVWSLSDTFNGLMAIPNLIALALLSGIVIKETRIYLEKTPSKPRRRSLREVPSKKIKENRYCPRAIPVKKLGKN